VTAFIPPSVLATASRLVALAGVMGPTYALASVLTPALTSALRKALPMTLGRRLLASLLLVSLLASPALAQDNIDKQLDGMIVAGGLTADQAAARARTASPDVARKAAELDAAIANAQAASLARVPQLTTKLSYTRLSEVDSPELAPGISLAQPLDNYSLQTQLVVPLSDYVLRFPKTLGAARTNARAAALSKGATELDAATAARLAYYEWVRAQLQVIVADRQLTQVRTTLAQVRALAESDRINKADLLRIESQEAEAQQTLDHLRTLQSLREEMLRLQIGARVDEHLTVGEDIRAAVAPAASAELDAVMSKATKKRLDFRALETAIAANEQRREAERANLLPRLSAFATSETANPNQRIIPAQEQFDWTWSAGVQLTFSLNDALISHPTRRRIAADTRALRADRENLSRAARLEVLTAQQNLTNARQALVTSKTRLAAAEESYRVRQAFLDAQRGTAVELVDAETDLTRARIALLDAHVDIRIATAELVHATGDDIH
jgi:outer membrane protein